MKTLKDQIKFLINSSGMENKGICQLLDDIRKDYHRPTNTGTKGLDSKPLSKDMALIFEKEYHISKNRQYVYYKGGWRIIQGEKTKTIKYLGSNIILKFIKK